MNIEKIRVFKKVEKNLSNQSLEWTYHADGDTGLMGLISSSANVKKLAGNIVEAIKKLPKEDVIYFEISDKDPNIFGSLIRDVELKEQGVCFFEEPLSRDEKLELFDALNFLK